MPSGSLLQLVATGSQDTFITTNPQITFFVAQYKRHSNFSVEPIEQTFNGTIDWGKRIQTTIARNGDLISACILEITMTRNSNASAQWKHAAEALLQDVTLEIGGTQIDKHYRDWFRIYDELYRSGDVKDSYRRLTAWNDEDVTGTTRKFFLPLIFYFNRTLGQALPMIALAYHEVKLTINLSNTAVMEAAGVDTSKGLNLQLYVDYVYLDETERNRFAHAKHELLIEQLQYTGDDAISVNGASQNIRINLNHPCKYLVWVCKKDDDVYGEFTVNGLDKEGAAVIDSCKLQLNGHDRFTSRSGVYFQQVTAHQAFCAKPKAGIYLYSFAVSPRDAVQPSGSLNFSRIDNANLQLTFKNPASATYDPASGQPAPFDVDPLHTCPFEAKEFKVFSLYAVNLNVLRISGGLAGLGYSN
jgi:hypothetical protein